VAIAYKQVHDAPPPMSTFAPTVPPAYDAVVMKLLAKAPTSRYPSADDLRVDLRRFHDGLPVAAQAGAGAAAATTVSPAVQRTTVQPSVAPTQAVTQQPTRVVPAGTRVATEPGYYEEPPRRSGWYVLGAVLAVLLIAIGGFVLYNALRDDSSVAQVTLLDFRNKTIDQAKQEAQAQGLVVAEDPQENDAVAVGIVYAQDPPAGQKVDTASQVKLTFNKGKGQVDLTNLVGQPVAQANAALAALGLTGQVTEQESDQPAGTVLAQDPAPGKVDAGSTVKLAVSKGVGQVSVPNVANFDVVTATSQLSTAGLAVTQAQEPSERVDAGSVIRTDPAAGQVVPKGTSVKIIVSSGPPQVGVPMVTGLSESEARDQLQAAGFLASKSDVDVPFGAPQAGKVVSQSPTPGTPVAKGSTVSIIVGKELPAPPTTTVPPTTTTVARTTTTT
jgi:serine/threonine-protein kinase